jgi:hypothetical protein
LRRHVLDVDAIVAVDAPAYIAAEVVKEAELGALATGVHPRCRQ